MLVYINAKPQKPIHKLSPMKSLFVFDVVVSALRLLPSMICDGHQADTSFSMPNVVIKLTRKLRGLLILILLSATLVTACKSL
jgi:hypothetical protein